MEYDLIVIGAGPAGSCAAAEAAAGGLRVALLEKHRLPRHKTCGGGMPMVVGEELRDLAPSAFVESDVRFMRHTFNFEDAALGEVNPAGCEREIGLWMVQRSIFDHELAKRAANAGADLIEGALARAIGIEENMASVSVERNGSGNLTLRGRHIVGADGANGITAKAVGLRTRRILAIGMEVEHPHRWGGGHADLRPDVLHLDYGVVRDGYAWIFPKREHLNVGAGLFRPRSTRSRGEQGPKEELRRAIFSYLDAVGVGYDAAAMSFHAHPLPLWNGKERLQTSDGRVLLAGDAAGMINPLFGDGILHAIRSGIIAARAVAENRPREYTALLHAEVAANFEAARRLAGPFYQFAGPVFKRIVHRPTATRAAARLLCGEALFEEASHRAIRIIRGSISALRPTLKSKPHS